MQILAALASIAVIALMIEGFFVIVVGIFEKRRINRKRNKFFPLDQKRNQA